MKKYACYANVCTGSTCATCRRECILESPLAMHCVRSRRACRNIDLLHNNITLSAAAAALAEKVEVEVEKEEERRYM